ncbi:hypothetical protein [Piscirickettsia salmonis]|uniref:hypothetical protein n=1 Tax=Piscirickettsia salmonis TaxID=1238 RepID=UPI0007C96BAF|nr:hypothetical protein A0O36_02107 [Piscirickettsiaceae bacterium NZ-RLO1]
MALHDLKFKIISFLQHIKDYENSKVLSRDKVERNVNQAVDKATSIASKLVARVANNKTAAKILVKMNANLQLKPDPSPSIGPVEEVDQVQADAQSRVEIVGELLRQVNSLESGRACLDLLVGLQRKPAFYGNAVLSEGYFQKQDHASFKAELTDCVAACKVQILADIRDAIIKKAVDREFEFGFGGTSDTLVIRGESFDIPKRARDALGIIDDPGRSIEEKLGEMRAIKAAAPGYQSGFLFFARTQRSTNAFFAGLDCGEDNYAIRPASGL